MKSKALALAAGALLGLSSAAMAQFTVFEAGPFNSAGPAGSALNGTFTYNYAGPSFTVENIAFSGDLTNGGIGTWASEARFRLTAPSGAIFNSPALSSIQTFSGTIPIAANVNAGVLGLQGAGIWTFEFFESFDDGGPDAIDAIWNNVNFQFVAPPPPPPAFGGNFTSTPNVLSNGVPATGTTIWDHNNPQPGLTRGAGEAAQGTSYPGFGWDLAGNEVGFRIEHGGGHLRLDLTGLSSDLDLVLLSSSGLPSDAIFVSQGFGGSSAESIEVEDLAAGTYYAVVDTFGATNAGSNFVLTYVPAPGALALLGMGGFVAARRRR